jgi:hypothetical protein
VYGVMAHEHLAGVDLKFDIEKKGGASACLLQDRWDFHWQRMYAYDAKVEALPRLEEGDKLRIRCTYDNTMKNPRHMSEPADIVLGEQTMNEMCIVVPQLLVKAPPKP